MTFEQFIISLAVALLAAALGGSVGTAIVIWLLTRKHDAALHARDDMHARELEAEKAEHAREVARLNARITALEVEHATLIRFLRTRDMAPPSDALGLTNGAVLSIAAALRQHYKLEELETLAQQIGIDVQDVGGDTLPAVALRLAQVADRRGLLSALRDAIGRERPNAVLT